MSSVANQESPSHTRLYSSSADLVGVSNTMVNVFVMPGFMPSKASIPLS